MKKISSKTIMFLSTFSIVILYALTGYFRENTNSNTGSGLFPIEFFLTLFCALAFLIVPTLLNIIGIIMVIKQKETSIRTEVVLTIFGFVSLQLFVIFCGILFLI